MPAFTNFSPKRTGCLAPKLTTLKQTWQDLATECAIACDQISYGNKLHSQIKVIENSNVADTSKAKET